MYSINRYSINYYPIHLQKNIVYGFDTKFLVEIIIPLFYYYYQSLLDSLFPV